MTNSTQPRHRLLEQPLRHFIDGNWVFAGGERTLLNPSTGAALAVAAEASAAEVDAAVQAARAAFDSGRWAAVLPAGRAALLWKLAELLDQHADELALLETLNTGMPIGMARDFNVRFAAESLRYNAGWATKLNGETRDISVPGNWHAYTRREALGVAGLIVPWNVPLAITISKLGAALAAGCSVVIKPAELTPLSAVRLVELCAEAGFPAGVVNLVLGAGSVAGQALVEHPGVDKISFTGSTAVGRRILQTAGNDFKRVSLELGGKSPIFIFDDADLSRAIPAAAMGIFANTGQVCAAGSRLFAHRKVYEQVVAGIAAAATQLKVGPGLEPETQIGPLISAQHRERVLGYIEAGRQEGAEVVAGGAAPDQSGYFIQPTVMRNNTAEMSMVREEIFGPVLSTFVFDDEDEIAELTRRGNDTPYGLAAYLWSENINRVHRMANGLKAGSIRVNSALPMDPAMPFGGYKQSGWGRENGREGVEAFTELKSVIVELGQ